MVWEIPPVSFRTLPQGICLLWHQAWISGGIGHHQQPGVRTLKFLQLVQGVPIQGTALPVRAACFQARSAGTAPPPAGSGSWSLVVFALKARHTFSAVMGISRIRTPQAFSRALAMAGQGCR